jgi:2-methylcitrate dehydratase PrpD
MQTVTQVMTDYVAAAKFDGLPPTVIHQAKRTFLNFIGCAVGGAFDDSVEAAARALEPFAGARGVSVLGRAARHDALTAALLNGMSSAVYSFDDTHAQAVVHAGGPVGSALLAYSQTKTLSGADFVLAFVLGVETVCRLSKAISVAPAQAGLHWIQTGICGGIGAAAAVGKAMNLDPTRLAWAIGIAAAQAAGIRGLSRSMCFSLMAGQAAQAGLKSALLAQQGFNGVADPLGGKLGFLESYSDVSDARALTDGLGTRFEILSNTFKPYPCGVVIHPVIDACLDAVDDGVLDARAVAAIEVAINPTSAKLADLKHPRDSSEAQMSLQHWVAAAIVDGEAGVRQSRTDKLVEPAIAALRDKIAIQPQPEMSRESAGITIHLAGGAVLRRDVQTARGSLSRPMTDREIEHKFGVQCADRLAATPAALASLVWSLETLLDCASIAELAMGKAADLQI